jgi:hypothetical protein
MICLTEMRRTSSEVKKEKDMPEIVEGRECEIFMAAVAYGRATYLCCLKCHKVSETRYLEGRGVAETFFWLSRD